MRNQRESSAKSSGLNRFGSLGTSTYLRFLELRALAPIVLTYTVSSWLTAAHFMADTGGYVVSILSFQGVPEYVEENPVVRDFWTENPFWDFGHLLWRPLGLLLFKGLRPFVRVLVGDDPEIQMFSVLLSLNFAAGLISVVLVHKLLRNISGRLWIANFVTFGFIFSHAFLNFTQTGSSYIAGLALLLIGLSLLLKATATSRSAVYAGLAFAGAVGMWATYVLAMPAAIASPLFMQEQPKRGQHLLLKAVATFTITLAIAYGIIMFTAGVHSLKDLQMWITASSHGVITSGVSRVVLGLARSVINMGNDGILIKRFLLRDPFSAVSLFILFRLVVWKLALFYAAAISIFVAQFFLSAKKRIHWLLVLGTIPTIGFAVMFDGGAIERYFPMYPFVLLLLGLVLARPEVPRWLKVAPLLFVLVATISNLRAMSRSKLERHNLMTAQRIEVLADRLNPNSRIVVSHLQDELVNFQASFPFHPLNRHNRYRLYPLLVINTHQVKQWPESFAEETRQSWDSGGEVWLSKRLFSSIPKPEWQWAEGDDRRVSWSDVHPLFSSVETDLDLGGEDGFRRLTRSERNRQILQRWGSIDRQTPNSH